MLNANSTLKTSSGEVQIYNLSALEKQGFGKISGLPFSIKILLESALRNCDGYQVTEADVRRIASWSPRDPKRKEIPFKPARVILQDFTGVPAVVDLAAMRSAMKALGGDPKKINPQVACDLVIDHSVQVDAFNSPEALKINMEKEFERNQERYEFLKWGQKAFDNFRVVPPSTGIVHQVNLEYLSKCVQTQKKDGNTKVFPDSLVGTDSHTTMINGLGVLGWGVGGIEAEAVMLGQPIYMLLPDVIGFKLIGKLKPGVTATDLVLTVTEILRKKGVVGKFVEYFGDGLSNITLADRATIANMAPEYGATVGFFPVDEVTLQYLDQTAKSKEEVELVERYTKEQGLFRVQGGQAPEYTQVVELNLSSVESSLAGPKRPQDRVSLSSLKKGFKKSLKASIKERGYNLSASEIKTKGKIKSNGSETGVSHGFVAIAAITSCTNTSNPSVMVGAGLLAKKAIEKGLERKPYVKSSLAPGSLAVTEYLRDSGLLSYLEKLGFYTVGYGCTTCIGNSGPLLESIASVIKEKNLVAASVLSGNRNFEGRINPHVKANYLASPPLVVAFALAGTVDIDLTKEPIGESSQGEKVYLKDIWPSSKEIHDVIQQKITSHLFQKSYKDVFKGSKEWNELGAPSSDLFQWRKESTYIQEPPFFKDLQLEPAPFQPIQEARVLVMVGDSVTTDHISPAGFIHPESPAGIFLIENNIAAKDFNSYGSRRGNDRVMTRGTFANVRLRNLLAPGTEGGWTRILPEGKQMTIYDASLHYKKNKTSLIILAGKEYGAGSSRDWAAKGTALLGVKAVIAESYERIHRSNLVGMGVLPLEYRKGESRETLRLTGEELYGIELSDELTPFQEIEVSVKDSSGKTKDFKTILRIDTPVEIEYFRNGGILQTVIRKLLKSS